MGNYFFFKDSKTLQIFLNKITLIYTKPTLFSFQKDWRKQHQLFSSSPWKYLGSLFSAFFKALCHSGFMPHRCFPHLTPLFWLGHRGREAGAGWGSPGDRNPPDAFQGSLKKPRTSKQFRKRSPFSSKALSAAVVSWKTA